MDSAATHRRGQAAPADLRAPPADERDRKADQREALADERDRQADEREKYLDERAQQVGVQAVSQVRQSREAIERSRTILSASRDRLDRNEATLRRAQASSQIGQAQSDRVARGEEAGFPATLRVTMTLMEAIARTERDIAETLQDMAAHSESKKAARRRKLAEDAIQGAHEADKRREHLQRLAEQWSEHANVVTLH